MPGKIITDHQVHMYKQHRNKHSQVASAAKAGISERSARRIDQAQSLPSQRPKRNWRTREDPLGLVWDSEVVPLLQTDVHLNAVTLLEELQRRYPGQWDSSVLRTLQRRMRLWRAQFLQTWATFVQAPVFGEIWFHRKDHKPFVQRVQCWLGRNGVGKTTLLATLMGHTTLKSGSIIYRGQRIEHLPVHARSQLGIGYVPQTRDIFSSLNVEENLLVAQRKGPWSLTRVYDLFPRLKERRENMGNQLSGGEQQMLSIARALMTNPDILLLDEPMEGLAPVIVEMLLTVLRKLIAEEALTVILVEQSMKLALGVTHEVMVLNRGMIAHQGLSEDLLANSELLAQLVIAH